MVDIGQIINGKYRIVRLIGDGGMGSVYEAHHQVLGAKVALKFLHPELSQEFNLKERFLQEARVSATIDNPHIVRVLDVDVANDVPYLVMDLLKGEPLQHKMQREKRLSVAQTMEYAQQILFGLEAAHARNIVHRDLKPDNVFITQGASGELLKILDFGIAKLRQEQGLQINLTQPGAVMGTPEYMAPEQAYSADQVDARSDVYSVGVMLFEMLSGKRPAEGETPQEIAHKILMGEALRLDQVAPDVPAGLVRVVHTAIEPRPEDRWENASALRQALLPFLPAATPPLTQAGSGTYTAPQTPFTTVKKTPRIDGSRPVNKESKPPTKVDHVNSLEIPIEVQRTQVPDTVPPQSGPPRASALPPATDPAVEPPKNRKTAKMEALPDRPSSAPARTVNIPASAFPAGSALHGNRSTVVTRSKRRNRAWGWWLLALFILGAGGAVAGYFIYDAQYHAPVPPPLPVRRAVPFGSSPGSPSVGSVSAAPSGAEADGPTKIAPLDPAALEDNPVDPDRWKAAPSPQPAPRVPARPNPNTANSGPATPSTAPPTTAGPTAAGTGATASPPVFTIPTSIQLPFPIPTSLPTSFPTSFPTMFPLPGFPPSPPPSST